MRNIWILTIGGSDIHLRSKTNWTNLRRACLNSLIQDRGFQPQQETDSSKHWYSLQSRVLGDVYGPEIDQYFEDIGFPLLDNFLRKFDTEKINIDKVIVILTDQTKFFEHDVKSKQCAYWFDTVTLMPIIQKYLETNLKVKQENQEFIILEPEGTIEGLDDWNSVLKVVQNKFQGLSFDLDTTIYVSHQAGTPAISSAVQFISLTKFGKQVSFLLGSERSQESTKFIRSSTYLFQLQIQEAKALLDVPDYAGVKAILKLEPKTELERYLENLLEAAIAWNYGEFKDFSKILTEKDNLENFSQRGSDLVHESKWWLPAYEAAYLAVIRLKQNNTIEAMFHSFRAVEGLMKKYIFRLCDDISIPKIRLDDKKIHYDTITGDRSEIKTKKYRSHGDGLYKFLKTYRSITDSDVDIYKFGEEVFEWRNKIFHNIIGLKSSKEGSLNAELTLEEELNSKEFLFNIWCTSSKDEWMGRVCGCLNFIAEQGFSSLQEASIMPTIHAEIENTLNQLLTPNSPPPNEHP
jgi:hypothetical protein